LLGSEATVLGSKVWGLGFGIWDLELRAYLAVAVEDVTGVAPALWISAHLPGLGFRVWRFIYRV